MVAPHDVAPHDARAPPRRAVSAPPPALIALPLRVGPDGRLARADPWDALMRLVRAMAATSQSAWPHAPWFGLEETFAAANRQLEEHPEIADALNRALAGLGVRWTRVETVRCLPTAPGSGERGFRVVLVDGGGRAVHADLALDRAAPR